MNEYRIFNSIKSSSKNREDKDRKLAGVRWHWIDDHVEKGVWFRWGDVWNKPIDEDLEENWMLDV